MDDLISRQAMLDGIDKLIKIHFDRTVVLYKARKVAEDLPSAQPETNCSEIPNNWIPCSERLPEEGEVVLTQAKFKDDMKMAVSSRIDYNYWTGWGTRDINIIAWMPLPKPYQKGEQNGTEK